jgi:citrate synthase
MSSSTPTTEIYSPGLEGVIAGETAISTVTGGLRYRGYPIGELVEKATFEETAYLLLHGELPTAAQLKDFNARLIAARKLPQPLVELLPKLPKDSIPMDVLRSGISLLAHFDPEVNDSSPAANLRKSERLLAQIPLIVADFYRISKGLPLVPSRSDLSTSANFLQMVFGKEAAPEDVRAFDITLILYAEHEFNASTFTARVIVSTLSDLHSGVVGAVGALKGALHGGANEKVMDLLNEIGTVANVDPWMKAAFARKARIMGFGHRVYKTGDVRAGILKGISRQMAQQRNNIQWEDMAEKLEEIMAREKNMFPNLDWPSARVYHALNLEPPLYTPIFVMSRITGWCAHIIEQLGANRLIRPRARYTGPEVRSVAPLTARG